MNGSSNISKKTPVKQATNKKEIFYQIWSIAIKIIIIGLVLFLAWNIYDCTRPAHAPIKKVKVVATYSHVTTKQLQDIIKPFLTYGFFYINVIRLQYQLLQIPWVHHAVVAREWPATLIIKVDEQIPIANWGKVALLNNEGKLFTPAPATFPPNLPLFFGAEDKIATINEHYQKMSRILTPFNFVIVEITLNSQHIWHLTLQNKIEIFLTEDKALAQLERLVKIFPKILARHHTPIHIIDLRYNNGIAVK